MRSVYVHYWVNKLSTVNTRSFAVLNSGCLNVHRGVSSCMKPRAGGSTWNLYSVSTSRDRRRLHSLSATAKRSAITSKRSVIVSQLGQRSEGLRRYCTSLRRFTASGCSESDKGARHTGGAGSFRGLPRHLAMTTSTLCGLVGAYDT